MLMINTISIVVPTLNEADNVSELVRRIRDTFKHSNINYEIIFIDDHSTDGTDIAIKKLMKDNPVSLHLKKGQRGKAYSLLQGFELAKYNLICMIDADLQYPPEAILPMYRLMMQSDIDVVVTERIDDASTSKFRQLSSKVFSYMFTRLLFGFNYDTQSGLKLFRKEVIANTFLNPTPWSFDLEFIVRSLENNYKVLSHPITFSKRHSGKAKVKIIRVTYELAVASIKLRLNSSRRKVKLAYNSSLESANKIVGVFILVGAVAGYSLLHPLYANALMPEGTLVQVQPRTDNFNGLLSDMFKLENSASSVDVPTDDSSDEAVTNQTDQNASSRKPVLRTELTAEQKQSSRVPPKSHIELAGSSFPWLVSAPTFAYSSLSTPLPRNLAGLWTASFIGIISLAAAYEIYTARQVKQMHNIEKVQ